MAKPFKITGATLFWASTERPNDYSGKYQVDLCNLPKRTVDKLEEMNVTVRNKGDDRGFYITAKSKFPILTVDKDGELVRGNVVGNNSVGDAVCVTYPGISGNEKFVGVNKLKVTQLEEFGDELSIDMDDIEEL